MMMTPLCTYIQQGFMRIVNVSAVLGHGLADQ
jgi:hypothetical protein